MKRAPRKWAEVGACGLGRGALSVFAACVLAGCSAPETGGSSNDLGPAAWQVVLDKADLDRAVLSVWGTAPDDVYAVGGPLGNSGFEALVVHFDGSQWKELAPGGTDTFWWIGGSGPNDVWMVGENGRITHYDGVTFTEHTSGTTATLWGVWSASPSDAWAVGGTPEGGTTKPNDVVLHWDGTAWTPHPLPGMPLGRALYKVWGTGSENLYVVGEAGTIWHRKGSAWSLESDTTPPLATGTLLTVTGCSATEIYAVGGLDVLRSDGATWTKLGVSLTNQVNGVACGRPGEVVLVGFGGLKQRLVAGMWADDFSVMPYSDLHAAWADGAGAFWAAGGGFIAKPAAGQPREGVVARYGKGQVADHLSP